MTNEQILRKAIEKAVKNGYKDSLGLEWEVNKTDLGEETLIFSHSFAKAFWGEDEIETTIVFPSIKMKEWELRLQQMVLEEQPLKYIEKFI